MKAACAWKARAMAEPPIQVSPAEWRTVQDILRARIPGRTVWAFGSRARRTAKPFSDLDLAVRAPTPLPADTAAALAEDFSESELPWKVDLVDWSTLSAEFRSVIERDRVVIQ